MLLRTLLLPLVPLAAISLPSPATSSPKDELQGPPGLVLVERKLEVHGLVKRLDVAVCSPEGQIEVLVECKAPDVAIDQEVFDQIAEVRVAPEALERLRAWRARFGLAIDNALNFLNNPDGIQGHDFATQIANLDERRVLQGRLTLVRYNNEPQFFLADAHVFFGLIADILEQLGPHTSEDTIDEETLARLREGLDRIERQLAARSGA